MEWQSQVGTFNLKGTYKPKIIREERQADTFSPNVREVYEQIIKDWPASKEEAYEKGLTYWNGLVIGCTKHWYDGTDLHAILQPVRYLWGNAYREAFGQGKATIADSPNISGMTIVYLKKDETNYELVMQVKGKAIGKGMLHTFIAGGLTPKDFDVSDPMNSCLKREAKNEVGLEKLLAKPQDVYSEMIEENGYWSPIYAPKIDQPFPEILDAFMRSKITEPIDKREVAALATFVLRTWRA